MINANAAIRPGTTCKKLGITNIFSGKKYTCIKSGKKLVWNKGVDTPTPTPTPTQNVSFKAGDSCPTLGLQAKNANDLYECRPIVGNKLVYTLIRNDFSPVTNPSTLDPVTICRVPDLRTTKVDPNFAIAYPAIPQGSFTNNGSMKIVVIGVDFSDAKGTGVPSDLWNKDLQTLKEWLAWYTNRKVQYNFVTYDKWLRLSKTYVNYTSDNNAAAIPDQPGVGGLTPNQISQEIVDVSQEYVDLSNTTAFFIYQPPSITSISSAGQWFNKNPNVQSSKYGQITSMMTAIGPDTFISKRPRWAYFLHENLHAHGLHGHSPKNPFRMGALSTADGWTLALLPWDMVTADWDKPGDIYCIDKSHVTSTDLKLVPLEREQEGLKSAFIKLNDHQVLVVESHRRDKWSEGTSPGQAAVMVNLIDTTVSTTWDNPEGYKNPSSTGTYLRVDKADHGKHVLFGDPLNVAPYGSYDIGVVNGTGYTGARTDWDLNFLMYPGESITYDGIVISLISGGDNDTIRISKTN